MNLKIALTIAVFLLPFTFSVPLALSEAEHLAAWDYDEQGEDWSMGSCSGKQQSPINVITKNKKCSSSQILQVTLNSSLASEIVDNGHTYEVDGLASRILYTASSGLVPFEAAQFHFHAPSEHAVDGKHYDLELHIVHKVASYYESKDTLTRTLAVVAVLFEVDEQAPSHPFLTAFEQGTSGEDIELNMKELLNIGGRPEFYSYPGSLTTPPCNETVNWFILADIQKMAPTQLDYFAQRWSENKEFAEGNGNNRELQPLNGRRIVHGNC